MWLLHRLAEPGMCIIFKVQQILQTLQGERSQGAIVAVSVMQNPDTETNSDDVLAFIHDYAISFTTPQK